MRRFSAFQGFFEGAGSGGEQAVRLFHDVVGSVPAYREFLREHEVDPASIRTLADFRGLPLMTKDTYHRRYPLPDLCRGGRIEDSDMIAVSSGSTGRPSIWPCSLVDELHIVRRFEEIFRDGFQADGRSTLAVICFPLGTWVGGLFTASCVRHLAAKGYPITVVAPGSTVDTASSTADVAESIRKQLPRTNSEYAHYVPVDRQLPQVDLRELGDPEYFPVGVKHRYTRPGPGT